VFNISHENLVVYEIMWKSYGIVRQTTADNSIRRWIRKVTNKHTQCILYYLLLSTATVNKRTRLNIVFIGTLPVLFLMHLDSAD